MSRVQGTARWDPGYLLAHNGYVLLARGGRARRRNVQYAEEFHPESSDVGLNHAGDGTWFIVVTGRVLGQLSGRGRSTTLSGRGRPVEICFTRITVCDKSAREKVGSDVGWKSDMHRAFLAPFPGTTTVTAVIPATNFGGNVFSLTDGHFHNAVRVASDSITTGD